MDRKERFIKIVETGDIKQLIDLLKPLSNNDKKPLSKTIKKIIRDKYIYLDNNRYLERKDRDTPTSIAEKLIYSEESMLVLELASFVCFDYNEIRRDHIVPSLDLLEELILPWYQPSWLNKYFLEIADFYFDYEKMLLFEKKGWLTPTKQFIADNAAYGLLESKENLSENIWYLFEYYTTIGNDEKWIKRFKELSQNGDISRERLLKESLLTSNRGFNKPMTNWFCRLFAVLEPTHKELLDLQDELFLSLDSPHSKAVGDALKYLKQISKDSGFKIDDFIEHIPLLLTWNTKSIITSTLATIDILIKTYPKYKESLGLLLVQTLGQEDESLQTKTVKLLIKHKLLETQSILEEVDTYADGLYHSTKELLPDLDDVSNAGEPIKVVSPQHIREDNRIIYPESFDELVFFFSQVFEGNNVYDFDLFVALLPKLYLQITPKNISKLEPVFAKAFKYYTSPPSHKYTETVDIMVQAFMHFGYSYVESFMTLYEKLENEYLKKFPDEYKQERKDWLHSEIVNFEIKSNSASVFNVHHKLILITLEKIKNRTSSEPLFLTTHSPCWIDAKILSKRLDDNHNIHPFELQVALSKTLFDEKILVSSSDSEINTLLKYMQIKDMTLPLESIKNPAYWLTPLLRKNDPDDLEKFAQKFQREKHDIPFSKIFKGTITHRNSTNTTFNSHCVQLIRTLSFDSIYKYTRLFTDDLPYILSLVPTMPNFILEARYKTPRTDFEVMMPMVIEIWGEYGDCNYLFVARALIETSKSTRQFSAELWIKATSEGTMNHQLLGETLGKLEYNEYAPLKRFTDLIVANMLNISNLHNEGLHTLLSVIIANMNDEPIKGTKKLLEIYLEVLSLTKLDVPDETMDKLVIWSEVKSLKGVAGKIGKKVR